MILELLIRTNFRPRAAAGSVGVCLVRNDIGGEELRCKEIFAREPRVRVEQLRFGRALAQFAQDQLDRDPGAANYSFPITISIDLDSFVRGHPRLRILGRQTNRREDSTA